ncbi:hypothetical protein N9L47_06325 [Rhodobacteraceae bacterium]|nr:hypothetical protein [Paracoccaceae bacterium]
MDRLYTSVEILSRENNELAIKHAIERVKSRLNAAPDGVLDDVLDRCNPETHGDLIGWIYSRTRQTKKKRPPRDWSPKRNRKLWLLYTAADLDCPADPPARAA